MSDFDIGDELAQTVWQDVQAHYEAGYMPSEATLQAALYTQVLMGTAYFAPRHKFPRHHVVAEPAWYPDEKNYPRHKQCPDIVIANEAGEITHIFELKYWPFWKGEEKKWKADIDKLISFVENKELRRYVDIDPESGKDTGKRYQIAKACGLHFVVVAQPGSSALCSETIKNHINGRIPGYSFHHWKGPSGPIADRQWTIAKVQ